MPHALCPMPYARQIPHVTEKGYTSVAHIMSDRSPIIQLPGRVFEIVRFWQILLVNPPLQESG